VECKAGQTVAQDWFTALDRFDALAGPTQGMVIMGGDQGQPRSPFPAISWRELGDAMESRLGTGQTQ
jgi:hypothetical protein